MCFEEISSFSKFVLDLLATNSISDLDKEDNKIRLGFFEYQFSWQLVLLTDPIKQDFMIKMNINALPCQLSNYTKICKTKHTYLTVT